MKEDKSCEKKMIDDLDGVWKDAYIFLQSNQGVENLGPLSEFTMRLKQFYFDRYYNHKQKRVYVRQTREWNIQKFSWEPCERSISFERKDKAAIISISSKTQDKAAVNEQSLILCECADGTKHGFLSWNSEKNHEVYSFEISKNGLVKPKTFKAKFLQSSCQNAGKPKQNEDGDGK